MEKSFLDLQKEIIGILGFWKEDYKSMLIRTVEMSYVREIIKEWSITDIIINGSKVLIKWDKRLMPLTDDMLKEKYGK